MNCVSDIPTSYQERQLLYVLFLLLLLLLLLLLQLLLLFLVLIIRKLFMKFMIQHIGSYTCNTWFKIKGLFFFPHTHIVQRFFLT